MLSISRITRKMSDLKKNIQSEPSRKEPNRGSIHSIYSTKFSTPMGKKLDLTMEKRVKN